MDLDEALSKLSIEEKRNILTEYDIKVDDLKAYKKNPIEELFVLKDFPVMSNIDKKTRPVLAKYQNGDEGLIFIPFDKYFKLLYDKLWKNPQFGRDFNKITMEPRMKDAYPYNIFYNTLRYAPETKDQLFSVKFTDLLCPSLGKLKSSLHLTFMADIEWIMSQFAKRRLHELPITIVHGYDGFVWPQDHTMRTLFPALNMHKVILDEGKHHSKLSIFMYDDDSIRIIIGSASLYRDDWEIYNQQLWISPRCQKLPPGKSRNAGESSTGFKKDLINYMLEYRELSTWIKVIENTDFSSVKVVLLYTIPKTYTANTENVNGNLHYISKVLAKHCTIPAPVSEHHKWTIVSQTASLGLLGYSRSEWLDKVLKSLSSTTCSRYTNAVDFKLIYPTLKNSRDSHLGITGSYCCTYERRVKSQQNSWLSKHQCQWKADNKKRSGAMAHSKSFQRISPDQKKMVYFFLTSANLSRSAWGKQRRYGFVVRSFEMGIVFLPKFFDEEYFEIRDVQNRKNKKIFPLIFDLPLKPYEQEDDALCIEELSFEKPWNELEDSWESHENKYYGGSFQKSDRSVERGKGVDKYRHAISCFRY